MMSVTWIECLGPKERLNSSNFRLFKTRKHSCRVYKHPPGRLFNFIESYISCQNFCKIANFGEGVLYAAHLEVQYNKERCQITSVLAIVVPTGIDASETWKTTNKITKMIDVFHRRCLRAILGISWRDHITNDEVMARSEQMALHDTVATRKRRFVGHILRLPTTRPASLALEWIPEDGRRRVGRPKSTWQDTLKPEVRF